jgi:hypothetical protein
MQLCNIKLDMIRLGNTPHRATLEHMPSITWMHVYIQVYLHVLQPHTCMPVLNTTTARVTPTVLSSIYPYKVKILLLGADFS